MFLYNLFLDRANPYSMVVIGPGARKSNQRTQTLSRRLPSGGLRPPDTRHLPLCAPLELPAIPDDFTRNLLPHTPDLLTKTVFL
jgi:hypothetical protein